MKSRFDFEINEQPFFMQKLLYTINDEMCDETTGHDFYHAVRVYKLTKQIGCTETVNQGALLCAAILHDYCRPFEKQTGEYHFGDKAIDIIKNKFGQDICRALGAQSEGLVYQIIREHECFDNMDILLETKCLQDADRIDAIGAVGIARTFMFSGAHDLAMYIDGEESEVFSALNKPHKSAYIHFYDKLLPLEMKFHLDISKKIAQERMLFMKEFVRRFENEFGILISQ